MKFNNISINNKTVVIFIGTFLAGLILGAYINDISISTFITLLATLLATLIGALSGAHYAFKLQNDEKKAQRKAENISAGNRAVFTLAGQFNKLSYIN